MKKTKYRIAERDGLFYPQVREKMGWIYWDDWKTIYKSGFGGLDTYYHNWGRSVKDRLEATKLIYQYDKWLWKEQELNKKIKYSEVVPL